MNRHKAQPFYNYIFHLQHRLAANLLIVCLLAVLVYVAKSILIPLGVFDRVDNLKPWGLLLGDKPAKPKKDSRKKPA